MKKAGKSERIPRTNKMFSRYKAPLTAPYLLALGTTCNLSPSLSPKLAGVSTSTSIGSQRPLANDLNCSDWVMPRRDVYALQERLNVLDRQMAKGF